MSTFKAKYKRTLIRSAVALAAFVMVSGCEASGTTTGTDGYFSADFVSVNPVVLPPGTENPGATTDPSIVLTFSITGHGSVAQAVIDPPAPVPTMTATPLASSSGSTTGNPIPVSPPIALLSSLTLDFSSAINSDDCLAKAAQAAAQGLHLLVDGEGQVSSWASAGSGSGSSGSTTGGTGPVTEPPTQINESGSLIQATKIISCELGPSVCAESEICAVPQNSPLICLKGTDCVPPPCQCQPVAPIPAPTATPLASSL